LLVRPSHMNADLQTDATPARRIASIDALRGLVIFTMIYVNDIAGVDSRIVPAWMRHYQGRSGMTFVDLVFPAFLFVMGMSVPIALQTRLARGEPLSHCLLHIVLRTLSLLFVGILMVNGSPDSGQMGWSGTLWSTSMFLSAILAFSTINPRHGAAVPVQQERTFLLVTLVLRVVGLVSLVFLAFAFRGSDGHRIITLFPFSIHREWYGILGLIGWAYLVTALVFLVFRTYRTAVLGCVVLLFCLYPADRAGAFEGFWLSRIVGIGGTLGSQGAIAVAGMLLASILLTPDATTIRARVRFALLFITGCSAGALLLQGLYGINKNQATPSWCLWACAITGALWLLFYLLADVRPRSVASKFAPPFAIAGSNVLLAYLLSEVHGYALELVGLGGWYSRLAQPDLAHAMARSIGCAVVILALTAGLNRLGFRLKL
jgi:heparan-alpha-glucosaminide N-acetyltransferase